MADWYERRQMILAIVLNVAVGLFALAFFAAIVADILVKRYVAPPHVYMAGMAVLAGLAGAHVVGSNRNDR